MSRYIYAMAAVALLTGCAGSSERELETDGTARAGLLGMPAARADTETVARSPTPDASGEMAAMEAKSEAESEDVPGGLQRESTPRNVTARDLAETEGGGETVAASDAENLPGGLRREPPTPYNVTARDLADMDEAELAAFETSLQDQVTGAFRRAPDLNASGIDVAVDGNAITLRGSVVSETQKTLAHNIAHTVSGVVSVTNELTVQ